MTATIFNVEYENNMRGRKRRHGEGKKGHKSQWMPSFDCGQRTYFHFQVKFQLFLHKFSVNSLLLNLHMPFESPDSDWIEAFFILDILTKLDLNSCLSSVC